MDTIDALIGPNSNAITWWQMSIRGFVIFLFLIALLRFGPCRAFGKNSAFDIVLSVILGSILSRALTGNSPMFPVLAASAFLMLLHWMLASVAFHTSFAGPIFKGTEIQLVREGKLDLGGMREAKITENDLREAMRSSGMPAELSRLHEAYLERNGSISVVEK